MSEFEFSNLWLIRLNFEPFAVLFLIDIVLSVKRFVLISSLRRCQLRISSSLKVGKVGREIVVLQTLKFKIQRLGYLNMTLKIFWPHYMLFMCWLFYWICMQMRKAVVVIIYLDYYVIKNINRNLNQSTFVLVILSLVAPVEKGSIKKTFFH